MKYQLNIIALLITIIPVFRLNPYSPIVDKEKYRITQLVEEKDIEYAYPHFSSDGKRILFQSNKTGKWQLYEMTDNINSIFSITNDHYNNNFPDWSPDDSKICFVSDRTGNEEIFIMDSDGKNIKQLTDNPARDIHPYWSPDGMLIYFSSTRGNGSFDIYSLDPLTKETIRLTNSTDDETCARKSPGSNEIVYLRNNDKGLDDVFVMNLNTMLETNITNTKTQDGWPCWSPDGRSVIYSAIQDGTYCLFKYYMGSKKSNQLS
ncbi:MAG TPA: hypothetical protein VK590_05610, partial [Saprospiraceae bacterium]|nr:hypothetical protein [Saprospiraceae bacterium]